MSEWYYVPTPKEMYAKHYTGIPNVFFDKIQPKLDVYSWSILCVFLRQLYGFQRNKYKLSLRVIAKKTEIDKKTVIKKLKLLLKAGLIHITQEADQQNNIATEYSLFTGKICI